MPARAFLFLLSCCILQGADALIPGTPALERSTLTALSIVFPVAGDENYNASVTVRYRTQGTQTWRNAQPLFRVHPETIAGTTIAPHFAGRIFDLRPATAYEVELRAVDADGSVQQTYSLLGSTRPLPPANPAVTRAVSVASIGQLRQAFSVAQAGDVITLADGIYLGSFLQLNGSGTATNPIVLRGSSSGTGGGAILDGGGCDLCNVLEIYGSGYVIIENLTIRNAWRAMRFQTPGAVGNVVRRVSMANVIHGIAGQPDQRDFYFADNVLEGRLQWPLTNLDDGGLHANDVGIQVFGQGHVVSHNRLSGFGDAIRISQTGSRAIDISGNDILWTYDNGIELDGGEGNVAAFRNRLTNAFVPLSVQPVVAGPAYIFRNALANVVDEPIKFHALATTPPREPNGVLVYHNTIWTNAYALKVWTPAASHHFALINNVFMGPSPTRFGITVDWNGIIDDGLFDYNGYFPEGSFYTNRDGYRGFPNFAAWQAGGFETHGRLLNANAFASQMVGPQSHLQLQAPANAQISSGSGALDAGLALANINDNFQGSAPDLGAQELGCPLPAYGPRASGIDESNEVLGCSVAPVGGGACVYSLTTHSASLLADSYAGTIGITAPPGCAWSVNIPQTAWVTITSGNTGTGNGSVNYSLLANPNSTSRSISFSITGETFTINQGTHPSNPGTFRSGFLWLEDVNGDKAFNAPPDRAFAFGGVAGDVAITGDWNGDGKSKVGVYRPANGLFILDYDGDGAFTLADKAFALGVGVESGDKAVVGDWNGDGKTKVGLFRQGFFWILDYNGNGLFEQALDKTYAFGGVAGDTPVVGDWNGDGVTKIGLFRLGFYWILDANGNGSLDNINGNGGDQAFPYGGIGGDVPVVGDWNGDGISKVGVFRQGFFWVLDANGNRTFDGTAAGQDLAFPFGGIAGDKPVVGKW